MTPDDHAVSSSPGGAEASAVRRRGPKPQRERFERRQLVEQCLLSGNSFEQTYRTVTARFPAHPATIREDTSRVRRGWARDDRQGVEVQRRRAVRRLRRLAGRAEAAGDYAAAVRAEDAAAKIGGVVALPVAAGGASPIVLGAATLSSIVAALGRLVPQPGARPEHDPQLAPRYVADDRPRITFVRGTLFD